MLKIQTEKILQKEMDRKVFLKNAGIAMAAMVGVTAVVKNLKLLSGDHIVSQNAGPSSYGYGAMVYGGKR